MRRVNDLMWGRLTEGDWDEPIAFFCECERDGCYRSVWLMPDEYRSGRLAPGWRALSDTHGGDEPTLETRLARLATRLRREFVCADCGYSGVAARTPDRCPMCGAVELRPPLAVPA
jgi:hypothetical protein